MLQISLEYIYLEKCFQAILYNIYILAPYLKKKIQNFLRFLRN